MTPNLSSGRYPDGADADDNINDFKLQANGSLAANAPAGATNIKVASVNGLRPGAKLYLGNEVATIKEVGTAGATVLAERALSGTKELKVQAIQGFRAGQVIKIGNEEVTIESVVQGRRPQGMPMTPGAVMQMPASTINLTTPIRGSFGAGTQVAGTGVTLAAPLKAAHAMGSPFTDNVPSPGAPNAY